jgi:hypothetical protein
MLTLPDHALTEFEASFFYTFTWPTYIYMEKLDYLALFG